VVNNFWSTIVLRERGHFLEIFIIQVDDIILPWVADGVPNICVNPSPFMNSLFFLFPPKKMSEERKEKC